MNVTKHVIEDLVVVYLSGEASDDTRRLVEEYLAADPEMAERVKASQTLAIPHSTPPPNLERRALDRTKQLLGRKHLLLWLAMLLSYLPLSFEYTAGAKQVTFLFLDNPPLEATLLALGLVGWAAFLYTCRRLHATGLEPSRSWGQRAAWLLGGMAAFFPFWTVVGYWTGWTRLYPLIAVSGGIALLIGEKLGQLAEARQEPPTTLFGSVRK